MQLKGQTAIVSGGLGDIGRAICMDLSRRGAAVAIGDIRGPDQEFLQTLGPLARFYQVDLRDADQVKRWIQQVKETQGTPTLIIPNAAVVTIKSLKELSETEWRNDLSVNLDGAFHLAHFAACDLVAQGKPGRIIFIGSWAAHAPHAHIPAYCVAKAGLLMLMKQMALEYAPHDILVNEIAPGYVNAGLSKTVDAEIEKSQRMAVPVRRLLEPDDVAFSVAHLCDPRNRHMTGAVLLIDGGLSLT
jgi:glucose 1-dehydrogenase